MGEKKKSVIVKQGNQENQDYMTDSQGRQVPVSMIKEVDIKRDEVVRRVAEKAMKMRDVLQNFKEEIRDDIFSFVELSAKQYKIKWGGTKGNIALTTYDGKYKLVISMNDNIRFDERLQVAKELIDKCLKKWSADVRPEIKVLINDAFQVDKQGKISTSRVLGLRRLDIRDEDWKKAMLAITESVQVTGTKQYLRIYERDNKGEYQMIPLDVAAL